VKDPLVTSMTTVCTLDTAIDRLSSKVEEFADTRDPSHLVFKPGARPFTFKLRPIGTSLMTSYVDSTPHVTDKWRRAFQVAVEEIDNVTDDYGSFRKYLPQTPLRTPKRELVVFSEDEVDDLAERLGGVAWIYEIGSVAYERSFLGKALSGGEVSWSLPPSSLAALARMKHHRAEQIRKAALTISSASSPEGSTPTSEPSSARPSAADAVESDGTSAPAASSPPAPTSESRSSRGSKKPRA
jgi:hypothetical protein